MAVVIPVHLICKPSFGGRCLSRPSKRRARSRAVDSSPIGEFVTEVGSQHETREQLSQLLILLICVISFDDFIGLTLHHGRHRQAGK